MSKFDDEWFRRVGAEIEGLMIDSEDVSSALRDVGFQAEEVALAVSLRVLTKEQAEALERFAANDFPDGLSVESGKAAFSGDQVLMAIESAMLKSWEHIDEPQLVLDGLLAAWGGPIADEDRRELLPRGLDRLFFGTSARARTKDRLAAVIRSRRSLS